MNIFQEFFIRKTYISIWIPGNLSSEQCVQKEKNVSSPKVGWMQFFHRSRWFTQQLEQNQHCQDQQLFLCAISRSWAAWWEIIYSLHTVYFGIITITVQIIHLGDFIDCILSNYNDSSLDKTNVWDFTDCSVYLRIIIVTVHII
jgi:hypothetical protein